MSLIHARSHLLRCAALLIGLTILAPDHAYGNPCRDAVPIDLRSVHRDVSMTAGRGRTLRLDLPSAGILTLDLTVKINAPVAPGLTLDSRPCDEPRADVAFLESSASRMVLAVRAPGALWVRASAQDPAQPLGAFRLTSRFVAATATEEVFDLNLESGGLFGDGAVHATWTRLRRRGGPAAAALVEVVTLRTAAAWRKTELEEFDPNPVSSPAGSMQVAWLQPHPAWEAKTELEEFDPNPASSPAGTMPSSAGFRAYVSWSSVTPTAVVAKTELEEFDPNPIMVGTESGRGPVRGFEIAIDAGELKARHAFLQRLVWMVERQRGATDPGADHRLFGAGTCRIVAADDHDDALPCATPLAMGRRITAEIANDWGDDADVFAFSLSALTTIDVAGSGATVAALYDRHGQRLAAHGAQNGGGFHLVRTLPAGRYFVRVEGDLSAEGPYDLMLTTRER